MTNKKLVRRGLKNKKIGNGRAQIKAMAKRIRRLQAEIDDGIAFAYNMRPNRLRTDKVAKTLDEQLQVLYMWIKSSSKHFTRPEEIGTTSGFERLD
jgi:hypothetical protein